MWIELYNVLQIEIIEVMRKGGGEMKYPDHLVKQVKERSAPYQLGRFLSGQGPENPKFMLLGEAPGETEIHNGIPFSGRAGKTINAVFRTYSRYKGRSIYYECCSE